MRLTRLAAVSCVLVFCFSIQAQQPTAPADPQLGELRSEVDQAIKLLQQTRQELQTSRDEVKALRAEIDALKSSIAPKEIPASADTQQQIEQLTEAQNVTDARLQQIDQSKVESGSKYRVRFGGLILFNAGLNRGSVDNSDIPMLAFRTPAGQTAGDINATMRQTSFNVSVNGPDFLGARSSGDVQFDFFGGFPDTLDGNALGLVRLRTAHAQLDWENGSLVFGQDQPFISPQSPTSLATIGTPALGYSGNLWTWTPQVVATRKIHWNDRVSSALQIGMLDPFTGQIPPDQFDRSPEPGEHSRVPAFAIRHALGFKIADRNFTIGAGALYQKQDYGFNRTVDGFAATLDWALPITKRVEVSGEFFRGRAIGGLWGGIGTSVVTDGSLSLAASQVYPVNAVGGWTQVKITPAPKWEINSAFGIDNPFTSDVREYSYAVGTYHPVLRNSTEMFNIIHRPRSNLVLSVEYRHLNTLNYTFHRYSAEHVNLGIGVYF